MLCNVIRGIPKEEKIVSYRNAAGRDGCHDYEKKKKKKKQNDEPRLLEEF